MANFPTIAIGLPFVHAGGFSAEALAWRTSIGLNSGTISDAKLQIIDDNFFKPALANGNILNQLDRLNIYAGLLGFPIAARTNLISSNFYVAPVSSPTFDNNGYVTSGTSYLNLQYKLFSQGVKFQKDNNSFGAMILSPAFAVDFLRIMGSRDVGGTTISALIRGNGTILNGNSTNSYGTVSGLTDQTGWTLIASQRNNSANYKTIFTTPLGVTTETTINTASSGFNLNDNNVFELTVNNGVSPDGSYDTRPHGASFHGSASLDIQAMRTLLVNTFTALGV
jgi:hypothetical protein